MPSWAMGFTPFFMVQGSEAVPLTNIDYDSPRQTTEKEIKSRLRTRSTNSTRHAM
jgi:hypothetical protein